MSFFKRLRSHAKQLILDANFVPFWVAYRTFFIKAGKTFFQLTHQVGMKKVVKSYKDFFGYFNALKTNCAK